MTDPMSTHAADQGRAAASDLGGMDAAYYRGVRQGGVPRWLAGALTLLRGAANGVGAQHCDDGCSCGGATE